MKTRSSILLGAVVMVSGAAWAGNPERSAQEQVCQASRALATAQLPDGWAWEKGQRKASPNVSGLVATALAQSAVTCGNLQAVYRYADHCLERHARGDFLYDPDVEFLARAAKLTGDDRYRRAAHEAFQRRYEYATGEEIVERWFMVKRDARLIGFEAAAAIRAALAVGEVEKAEQIAHTAAKAGHRWVEGWDPRGFLTTSRGAMLEALSQLQEARGGRPPTRLATFQRDLVHHLLLSQGTDGSWEAKNTQSTAYAVRGLLAAGDASAVASAKLGARWLRMTQLQDGSWASYHDPGVRPAVGDVIHEVTAEVLLALR